jgi:uncharacterized peroxidase-related enzyme
VIPLKKIDDGHGVVARIKLAVLGLMMGGRAPDVLRVLLYRPELFGKAYSRYTQVLLRGPSDWTVGERELFSAFVSHKNECKFCYTAHSAVAAKALGADVVEKVFADWQTAPVSDAVKAGLAFLEKLVLGTVTEDDAKALRSKGVSQEGAELLVHICANFTTINSIADSLGFEVPSATQMAAAATQLLKHGYQL